MYATKNKRIAKLIIQQTGTYNQQYLRPYEVSMNGTSQKEIINIASRAAQITPTILANVANQFISPSATPEGLVGIVNGWETQRLRYLLHIETEDNMGGITNCYYVGYTDHPGISYGGAIDKRDMIFHINAVHKSTTITHRHATGTMVENKLVDASQIIVDPGYDSYSTQNKLYGLRPEDVFVSIENQELRAGLDNSNDFYDARDSFNSAPKKSKMSNNVVGRYVSGIIDSWKQTRGQAEMYRSEESLRQDAVALVESDPIAKDVFMSFLQSTNGVATNSSVFRYMDLYNFDPNVDNVTYIVPTTSSGHSDGMHRAGQTSHWNGTDYATQFAAMLAQQIPYYMLQHGFMTARISSTNHTYGGEIVTLVEHYASLNQGYDQASAVQAFTFKLNTELLNGLSHQGQTAFNLVLNCDLLGETWISVSINGAENIDYVVPSFADSLTAPIMTHDFNRVANIASDFDNIMHEMSDVGSYTANAGY